MSPRTSARFLGATALVAALGSPARGHAEDDAADEPTKPALDVTVRGSTTPAFVSRASIDDRAREPVDAASLVAELPSVHVRRLGADGAQATLSIRGSASTQVGVLLAGIPLTSGADPSFDVGALPLWPGASFRVYRGFAPASLGATGYLGGVLVIDPPTPLAGARTEWQALAGSFGALKVRAGDARKIGDVTLGLGVFGARSDGDFSYEVTDPFTGKRGTRTRTNAGAVSAGAVGRVALERSWGSVGATFLADARRVGLPGSATYTTLFPRLETDRLVLGVDATVRDVARGSLRLQAWGRREGATYSDPYGEIDPTRVGVDARQTILAAGGSVGYRVVIPRAAHASLGVFLDLRGESLTPPETSAVLAGTTASRLAGGAGVELELRPSEPLRLFATARLDARRDRATDVPALLSPTGDTNPTAADLVPSGHLGASYRFSDAAILSAHGGFLRRFPSFVELYGDRGSLLGDPRLRVEGALAADVGVHGDVAAGRATFRYELVGFVTSPRDLIVFLPLGRSTFRASNVDAARIVGAEVSASLVAANLATTLSYTLMHTENLGADPLSYGRPLPGRPLHDLSYDAAYRFGPVRLRYGIDAVAGTTVDTAGTLLVPPRFFHSAGASLDVPRMRALRIGVEVQNLFDVRTFGVPSELLRTSVAMPVSDFLGFPLPGRTLWVTARYRAP
ncbi:TonB-dependent receptor plug domain-containing protein [Polyangium mundeleinium]|uniref:TonB-dependent receptor n=1 Tax=Polyangium mundeleinium TaxID=2995306 RepID=A0ABT5F4W0_9BACT|nr:TonB-dependent receptor plug domain-containing protein [Polyangium mundeleinium]MDC0749117.1 TonB-dependent receptor [Polyangium mundeleinium]